MSVGGPAKHFEAPGPDELERDLPAAAESADVVAVAGGDGSLNLVINALEEQLSRLTFLLLPGGTGNDLARTLDLPESALEAADLAGSGKRRAIDVWRADWQGGSRLFVNASMGGFTVEVNKAVDEDLKKKVGPVAFWIGGAKAAKDLQRFTLTANDVTVEDCVAVGVGNGRTCGGGIEIWPSARPDDGLLDLCAIPVGGLADAAKVLKGIRSGEHAELDAVRTFQAREVKIDAEPSIELNLDGELVDLTTPVTFSQLGQTHLIVP